ncbi:hypothetical protein MJO28_001526 [Puccinia striiformis f. sp. tritici]|uniref:Uncharacterized protein n=1 Tax=Puccinia striiformis f. sp. tritici TaxID=168172 RepID=A0ACC0EUC4_9BASI|nr:hypothetical protein MJO28_001526 [Puccinia striiformis f. sp. tritici]
MRAFISQPSNILKVYVCVLPLVGDMAATHKVTGFTSHCGTHLCLWCMVAQKDLAKLKLGSPQKKNLHLSQKFEELDEGDWEDTDSGDDLDEDRWHAEFDLQHGTQATLFSEAEKKWIQKALEEVVVPSGTSSVPKDLGDVRHGKLKDDEWRSLFMYIIPLVVMDLLVLDVDNLKSNST